MPDIRYSFDKIQNVFEAPRNRYYIIYKEMVMKLHVCIAVVIVIFCSGILSAQGIGFGPVLGYQKASDADEGTLMVGAALRVKLTPTLGVEGAIHYRYEEYRDGLMTVKSWPVMASALLYAFPIVYGTVGMGWYNTTYEFDDNLLPTVNNRTEQEFGWHLGAGIELPFFIAARITADVRYVFIDYDVGSLVDMGNVRSDFYVISVGLLFGI